MLSELPLSWGLPQSCQWWHAGCSCVSGNLPHHLHHQDGFWLPFGSQPPALRLVQELSVLWRSLKRRVLLSGVTLYGRDLCVPCVPHLSISAEMSSMMWRPAQTFPFVVASVSLEECGRSQHSCMKTELTLCYISSLLTWNSTVSFLADK